MISVHVTLENEARSYFLIKLSKKEKKIFEAKKKGTLQSTISSFFSNTVAQFNSTVPFTALGFQ